MIKSLTLTKHTISKTILILLWLIELSKKSLHFRIWLNPISLFNTAWLKQQKERVIPQTEYCLPFEVFDNGQSLTARGREGYVLLVTSLGIKTSWRPPWRYDVLLCLLSYSKITKDVSASQPLNRKTPIAYTRIESALNRNMVNYGNFFTLCWHSCFLPQLGIPASLQFFGKKGKRNTVQR